MRRLPFLPALAAALLAGCGPPGAEPPDGGPDGGACAPGFAPLAGGPCVPVLPDAPCPAGTMAVPTEASCVPVGWSDCPEGFEPEPSGFGCRDVLPATACIGATREAVGGRECQPLGDCTAPFPPPEATLFVDRRFAYTQLDATHHHFLYDAYRAAPPGAVIAVERGTYHDVITVRRDVRIVGRCAAEVIFEARADAYAVMATDGAQVTLSGLTLRGYSASLVADAGATVRFEDGLIEGARGAAFQAQHGGLMQVVRSAIRDPVPAAGYDGVAGQTLEGGRLEVLDSALTGSHAAGIMVAGAASDPAPTELRVERSVIRDVHFEPLSGNGFGMVVAGMASAEVRESVIARASRAGLIVSGVGARAVVSRTVLRDGTGEGDPGQVVGLVAQDGARLELHEVQLQDAPAGGALIMNPGTTALLRQVTILRSLPLAGARGQGLTVAYGGRLEFESLAVVESEVMGLYVGVDGAVAEGRDLLVTGTLPGLSGVRRGVSVEDGLLRVDRGTLLDNGALGLFIGGEATSAHLTRVLLGDAPADAPEEGRRYGYGALTRFGAHLDLDASVVRGAEGVALAFSEASGRVRRTLIADNGVALHVQDGSRLEELAAPPELPAPGLVTIGRDVVLSGNTTRLGSGQIPMPTTAGP